MKFLSNCLVKKEYLVQYEPEGVNSIRDALCSAASTGKGVLARALTGIF
jgi:hypothetical protein